MAALPRNRRSVCVTHEPVWDVLYDGQLIGYVRAGTAYDAKRRAELDYDIVDFSLLRVRLSSDTEGN